MCTMKVTAGIFAPATDQSIERSLSQRMCRKKLKSGETLMEACSGTDMQIRRHTWV